MTGRSRDSRGGRFPFRLATAALAVLLLAGGVGFFTVDALTAVRELQSGVAELQQATSALRPSSTGLDPSGLRSASRRLQAAARQIDAGSARFRANPLVRVGAMVPGLRDQDQAASDLVGSAEDGTAAAQDLLLVAEKYQEIRGPNGQPGPRLVSFLSASNPAIQDARRRLDSALSRLQADLRHSLLPPLVRQVQNAIRQLAPVRDQVASVAALGSFLPAAVGGQGRKTYLLLFTNPAELRPAGGFVGSFGVMTIDHGTPISLTVHAEEELDGRYRARFAIPAALGSHLGFPNNSLDIGDAGWDPDFRTSAALSEQMYSSATGQAVDGTIAIDPYAIAAILRITGPVDVPQYGNFTADNFFARVDQIVNLSRAPSSGKKALPLISAAVIQRLFTAPLDRWPQMLTASEEQARTRHVQLFLHDAATARALSSAHYDGAVLSPPEGHDYLMVVDANVGGNKADGYVMKSAEEKVEVMPGGVIWHELVLRYSYPSGVANPPTSVTGDTAYRDYLRVMVPETSSLTGFYQLDDKGARQGSVDSSSVDHGKRTVGTFFRLPVGSSLEVHVLYRVPADSGGAYRLFVQKQAGVTARPLDVLVSYPGAIAKRHLAGEEDGEVDISW